MRVKRSVSLAIHDRQGRVLLVQRPADDEDLPLVWGLPAASLVEDEGWGDAVRRAARDKLGVDVEPGAVLREGSTQRPGGSGTSGTSGTSGYRLEMRLYEARITVGAPSVPQAVEGVTQYRAWRWGDAADLEPAAASGSLCSRLYLETT